MCDDLPLNARPMPEAITPYHNILAMMAQDSLEQFWSAVPGLPAPAATLRRAARNAIDAFHRGKVQEDQLPETFMTSLNPSLRDSADNFIRRILWRDDDPDFGYWQGAISPNQHETNLPPMSPEYAAETMDAYRQDVVKAGRAINGEIEGKVRSTALSDWDMFLHSTYGFCFEAHGEWPESVILASLRHLLRGALFERFLRRSVLTLPLSEQHALGDVVRAEWADLWSDDDVTASSDAVQMPSPGLGAAAAIPDAKDLLS
ncbi:hypothetical protein H4P12_04835 [Paracoccus sp. 11-3]|uniref:Uncharacterized protein n=1 Tax=Paracoccus amoyensis TaxID=2760093 RepID=A0A926G7S0_9RHOB|nr:hypothetical protein [Paracoccus amoyensis]MBC9246048.1 hypothetical protein [Paracoccus amoyensis]